MKLKSAIIAAAVASVFSVSAQAATDLVTNGSFEADLQGAGSWNIYSGLTGWSLSSGSGIELRNNVAGASQDGVNYVELDSGGNSAISQTLITVASQLYDVSFWYSPREGVSAESNPID